MPQSRISRLSSVHPANATKQLVDTKMHNQRVQVPISSRKLWSIVLLAVLVLAAFDVEYGGIKLIYLLVPLTFFFPRARKLYLPQRFYFVVPTVVILVYGYILREMNGIEIISTIRFSLNLIMLMWFSRNIFLFMSGMSDRGLRSLFSMLGYIFITLLIVDVSTSIGFGNSIFAALSLSSESYLLGQILTTEPNWLSGYLSFVALAAMYLLRINLILPLLGATLFQLLLNPSRIAIAVIIAGMIKRKSQLILLAIFIPFLLYVSFLLDLMPSSWTYDLGSNSDKNPRIFDFLFIDAQIPELWDKLIGSGLGNIYHLTASMTWRENYYVSNQLWLHIYVNYGYVGVVTMFFWMIKIIVTSPKRSIQLKILLFIFLQLHNSLLLPSFWVVISLIALIDQQETSRKIR